MSSPCAVPVLSRAAGPAPEVRGEGSAGPLRFACAVRFEKEEVFEICAALALAEVLLAGLGRVVESSRMAAMFDLAEGRLAG